MAATLTAYIPNSKITVVETTEDVPFGFIDTTSYLTRIKVLEPPPTPPIDPPDVLEVVLTLGSGFIIGQLKKIKLVSPLPPSPLLLFQSQSLSPRNIFLMVRLKPSCLARWGILQNSCGHGMGGVSFRLAISRETIPLPRYQV